MTTHLLPGRILIGDFLAKQAGSAAQDPDLLFNKLVPTPLCLYRPLNIMSRAVLLLFIGLASANVCQDVVHKASCSAEMDPRSCVECVRNQPAHLFTGANCTSADIRRYIRRRRSGS